MDDECKLQVAREALNDQKFLDEFYTVDAKPVALILSSDIVSDYQKDLIKGAPSRVESAAHLKQSLDSSTEPDKMTTFFGKLEKTKAKNLRDIHTKHLNKHKEECRLCQQSQSQMSKKTTGPLHPGSKMAANDVEVPLDRAKGFRHPFDSKLTKEETDYIWNKLDPNVCQIGKIATGFVIGSLTDQSGNRYRMILTCHHVGVQNALEENKLPEAVFNRHSDEGLIKVHIKNCVCCDENLDYGLFILDHSPNLETFLEKALDLTTLLTHVKPKHNDSLILLGHTNAEPKTLDTSVCVLDTQEIRDKYGRKDWFRDHKVLQNHSQLIFYQCSSLPGSSGAPCIDVKERRLYAMHSQGVFPEGNWKSAGSFECGVLLKDVFDHCHKTSCSDERIHPEVRKEIERLKNATVPTTKYWSP